MAQVENEKLCAILSYVMLIGVIWYFVDEKMKKSTLAKFHTKQALVLFIASSGISIVMFVTIILIPFLALVVPASFILWIIGIINAANEQQKELPVIGSFAKHLTY